MSGIHLAVVLPFFVIAAISFANIGNSGPRYERRYSLFTFPDLIWTAPLVGVIGWVVIFGPEHRTGVSWLFVIAIISFAFSAVAGLTFWSNSKWTKRMPAHMHSLAYARMRAAANRAMVRTTFWQGVLLTFLSPVQGTPTLAISIAAVFYLILVAAWLFPGIDESMARSVFGRNCYLDDERRFDMFVSYKSQHVESARDFSDLLIANQLKPWFAEYLIRFHSRDRFQQAIFDGIAGCNAAILFTNDDYFESKHCLMEFKSLVEKQPEIPLFEIVQPGECDLQSWCRQTDRGPHEGLIDVAWLESHRDRIQRIPSAQTSAELQIVGTLKHGFLKPNTASERYQGTHTGQPFSVEVGGWKQTESVTPPQAAAGTQFTPGFTCDFGLGLVRWEICLGAIAEIIYVDPDYSPIAPVDDEERWLYNDFRDAAMLWLAENASECHGVHLFWMNQQDRHPHLMMTHWGRRQWHRRYWIQFERQGPDEPLTFCFAFYYSGHFEQFALHFPVLDAVVRSLRLEDHS